MVGSNPLFRQVMNELKADKKRHWRQPHVAEDLDVYEYIATIQSCAITEWDEWTPLNICGRPIVNEEGEQFEFTFNFHEHPGLRVGGKRCA